MLTETMCARLAAAVAHGAFAAQGSLKVNVHQALTQRRDAILRGDSSSANMCFAYAYHMCCVCVYMWKHYVAEHHKAAAGPSRGQQRIGHAGSCGCRTASASARRESCLRTRSCADAVS